jgi:hypothetical protein
MSLFVEIVTIDPTGRFAFSLPLWQYYGFEVRRAMRDTGALGPDSGSTGAAIQTAIQHVLCSIAGGAVTLGIGWGIGKLCRR